MLALNIQILKKLDNKYVVNLFDLIETKTRLHFVMERCYGNMLITQIVNTSIHNITKHSFCNIIHQIATGVKYMHNMGIIYKDLRPENILFVNENNINKIKICDIGISNMYIDEGKQNENELDLEIIKYKSYNAPEIINTEIFDYRCDYWNIGIIMFILLIGYHPFTYSDVYEKITESILYDEWNASIHKDDSKHISKNGICLLKGLLEKEAINRKTCDDILNSKWIIDVKSLSFLNAIQCLNRGASGRYRRERYTPLF
eukprot:453336_1